MHPRTWLGQERAQGTVELAIIVPFLIFILLGVVDYSRFLYYQQAIISAARAGGDMAINHCPARTNCGMTDTPVGDDFIVQSVYCDAAPRVQLSPQASTCASCLTNNCTSPAVCGATCLANVCVKDICTSPTPANRMNGGDVTVYVGYSFKPISPFVDHFFPTKSCWSSDPASNHHTLCASAVGSVS